MAFATKYQHVYDEVNGPPDGATYTPITWRIDILEDGFAGSVTELKGTQSPVEIEWDTINLYREHIMPSKAKIRLVSDSTFSEFITADEEDYRVDIYKDGTLYWQGFVLPGSYEEEFVYDRAFDVLIEASDGLERLRDKEYAAIDTDDVMGFMASVLNTQIGMSLNIIENVDLYEDNQATGAANSPLELSTIYRDILRDGEDNKWTAWESLTQILKAFQCIVYQEDAEWKIRRIPANDGGTYTERTYNSSGVYQSNTTGVNPVLALTNSGNSQIRMQSRKQYIRPVNLTKIKYEGWYTLNYCDDGYFNLWEDTSTLSRWTESGSITYSRGDLKLGHYVSITSTAATPTSGDYIQSNGVYVREGQAFELTFQILYDVTGSGSAPETSYQILLQSASNIEQYFWDVSGNQWTKTTTNNTDTADTDKFGAWSKKVDSISATPIDGYISVRLRECDPNGYTLTELGYSQFRIDPEPFEIEYFETIEYEGETTDQGGVRWVDTVKFADSGLYPLSGWASTDVYQQIVIRIDFGSLINNDQFQIDIDGTTTSYIYQSSPSLPVDFSTRDELLSLIRGNITNDEYSAWYTLISGNTYDFYVEANFYEQETGGNYAFNYSDNNANMSQQSETTDVNPVNLRSLSPPRAFLIGADEEISTKWTDGNVTGALMDVMQKCIHNQFGAVTYKHRGKVIDYSKNVGPSSVLSENSKYFMFTGGTLETVVNEWSGTWQEVRTTTKAFTKTVNRKREE